MDLLRVHVAAIHLIVLMKLKSTSTRSRSTPVPDLELGPGGAAVFQQNLVQGTSSSGSTHRVVLE